MPSGQPVPVTAMTPYDDQPIPVVATRVTRAMTAPSLRRPSSSSASHTLSEHTLFPTPVDARPGFVPFQLSDEQCACPQACPRASRASCCPAHARCVAPQMPTSTATRTCMGTPRCRSTACGDPSSVRATATPGLACWSHPATVAAAAQATSSSKRGRRARVDRSFWCAATHSRPQDGSPPAEGISHSHSLSAR